MLLGCCADECLFSALRRSALEAAESGECGGDGTENDGCTPNHEEVVDTNQSALCGKVIKTEGLEPTNSCDDRAFVRRVYLDLVGRIPKGCRTGEMSGKMALRPRSNVDV